MTLVVTHAKVSGKAAGNDPNRVYGTHWDANHTLTGTTDASQLNANVVQAITNDTNVTGSIASQTLTLGWTGTLAATRLNSSVVQGITNDTNITGSISAQNLTLGWTGTLAAARLNSNVVQAVTNDTNITGSIAAQTITLGWTGTLAAGRLNANVVQGVTNDTNVTGSISAQNLTLGWTGTLANARLANMNAYTFKGNATGSAAAPQDFTIDGLTLKGTPASTDELIIWDVAGAALKKATVSSLAGSSGVSSIAGNTGAFTLAGGVTNSTNQIQLDGNYTGFVPNCTLAASVSLNILTVALKDNAGNDPSATSPVFINYRSATASTGTTTLVAQTSALSITTNATGATLGSSSNTAFRFWVVSFNNAGTNVLALINCSTSTQIFPLNEGQVASSTPMSGTATSAGVFYTPNGTTITSKAFRILGYVEYNSTGLATAGTYATGPNFIQSFGPGIRKPGESIQVATVTSTSNTATSSSTFQSTNLTLNMSPTSAANPIRARASGTIDCGTQNTLAISQIFRGSTAIGSQGGNLSVTGGESINTPTLMAFDLPNTTSSTNYLVKFKSNGTNTATFLAGLTGLLEVEEVMG